MIYGDIFVMLLKWKKKFHGNRPRRDDDAARETIAEQWAGETWIWKLFDFAGLLGVKVKRWDNLSFWYYLACTALVEYLWGSFCSHGFLIRLLISTHFFLALFISQWNWVNVVFLKIIYVAIFICFLAIKITSILYNSTSWWERKLASSWVR